MTPAPPLLPDTEWRHLLSVLQLDSLKGDKQSKDLFEKLSTTPTKRGFLLKVYKELKTWLKSDSECRLVITDSDLETAFAVLDEELRTTEAHR